MHVTRCRALRKFFSCFHSPFFLSFSLSPLFPLPPSPSLPCSCIQLGTNEQARGRTFSAASLLACKVHSDRSTKTCLTGDEIHSLLLGTRFSLSRSPNRVFKLHITQSVPLRFWQVATDMWNREPAGGRPAPPHISLACTILTQLRIRTVFSVSARMLQLVCRAR